MEYTLKKMLSGVANGKDVPGDWEVWGTWVVPGTNNASTYEKRSFVHGGDLFYVWVAVEVPEEAFQTVMFWQREMYRGDLVSAQKSLLNESVNAATNYANVLMVVVYAGLFALLTQMTGEGPGKFTPLTSFSVAICLGLSVFAFFIWEVFGITLRMFTNAELAQSVKDPSQFEKRVNAYRDRFASLVLRFLLPSHIVFGTAVFFAAATFLVMLSALINGAWLTYIHAFCTHMTHLTHA